MQANFEDHRQVIRPDLRPAWTHMPRQCLLISPVVDWNRQQPPTRLATSAEFHVPYAHHEAERLTTQLTKTRVKTASIFKSPTTTSGPEIAFFRNRPQTTPTADHATSVRLTTRRIGVSRKQMDLFATGMQEFRLESPGCAHSDE